MRRSQTSILVNRDSTSSRFISNYSDNISELKQVLCKELECDNDQDQDDTTSKSKPQTVVPKPHDSTEETSALEWIILHSTRTITIY